MPKEHVLELVKARVASVDRIWEDGIIVTGGETKPFVVERAWSGPAGNYREVWSIRRGWDEIMHTSEGRRISVWGMQAVSEFQDRVDEPLKLGPGSYRLVFIVENRFMGSRDFVVRAEEAAA